MVILTCAATWGISSAAIARDFFEGNQPQLLAQGVGTPPPTPQEQAAQQKLAIQGLQTRLKDLGYYPGAIDGIYGNGTRAAVAAFQEASGLTATGIVDAVTQSRLISPDAPRAVPQNSNNSPSASPETAPSADGGLNSPLGEESGTSLGNTTVNPDLQGTDDGRLDINLGGADSTDGAAAPSEGSPPSNGESAADGDASNNRALFRLALVGLAIIIFGALGGGALLLLSRRGEAETKAEEDLDKEPLSPMAAAGVAQNGSQQAHSVTVSSGTVDVDSQALSEKPPASPRLAKVNIVDELIDDLNSIDPEVRRKAVWELGQRGNSAAVRPLVGLLVDADSHEQSLILAALSEIGTQTLKPVNRALAISLQDDNPDVRKNAIRDLTRIYNLMGQAGRMLGHAAQDDDPEVRKTAHWALDQLNHMRLSATETAGLLKEADTPAETSPQSSEGYLDGESLSPSDESSSPTV